MDNARRKPAPPRISIGDPELGRTAAADRSEDHAAFEGNTLVGDRMDPELYSMEQRCESRLHPPEEPVSAKSAARSVAWRTRRGKASPKQPQY
jgi:hypothetical protein